MQDFKTVLIVEDEPLIAMTIEDLIREMELIPYTAVSLDEALSIVEAGGVRLAILDYSVVGGSTEPVAKALKERDVPFILSSGSQIPQDAAPFEGAPCLLKPYAEEALRQAMQALMTPSSV
jgi:CheY-like chemotaxis protein